MIGFWKGDLFQTLFGSPGVIFWFQSHSWESRKTINREGKGKEICLGILTQMLAVLDQSIYSISFIFCWSCFRHAKRMMFICSICKLYLKIPPPKKSWKKLGGKKIETDTATSKSIWAHSVWDVQGKKKCTCSCFTICLGGGNSKICLFSTHSWGKDDHSWPMIFGMGGSTTQLEITNKSS